MSITKDSTLAQVYAANLADWKPSADDTKQWVKLTAAAPGGTADTVYTTTVGLFGADLTDFLADCELAATACKVANYDNYSGWAFGINIVSTTAVAGNVNVISFEAPKYSVALTWGATGGTPTASALKSGTIAAAPAAAVPADLAAITPETTPDAFNSFASTLNPAGSAATNLIVGFLDSTDDAWSFEVGDKVALWNALGFAGGVKTDVTLAGASQLLAAATATLAATLLF